MRLDQIKHANEFNLLLCTSTASIDEKNERELSYKNNNKKKENNKTKFKLNQPSDGFFSGQNNNNGAQNNENKNFEKKHQLHLKFNVSIRSMKFAFFFYFFQQSQRKNRIFIHNFYFLVKILYSVSLRSMKIHNRYWNR